MRLGVILDLWQNGSHTEVESRSVNILGLFNKCSEGDDSLTLTSELTDNDWMRQSTVLVLVEVLEKL